MCSVYSKDMPKATNLERITYRLHEQRAKLAPSLMLRKNYLEATHLGQIQSEKDAIVGHINKLQPGVRREYLRRRMEWLNARAKQKAVGV